MLNLPQIFGKYTLQERIAIGGMAEIFRASAPGLGGFEKVLAIKRLHPRYSDDQDFIRMLVDEARIAVQLNHSNIGQIFDLSREEDLVYIAMEYIDGRDLYRILRRAAELDVYLPLEVAAFAAMEMCAGLDYAHRKEDAQGRPLEIIHRDISPQNILVSWEGEVKIVDFGIAKAAMRAFETESGVIKGKFYYMSPEQARGDKLDQRTDIFSAGIVLYEMLTGMTVYREEDDVTLLSRVRRAEIDPPTTLRSDIPLELERIVMKALARDPRRRYQSAHQFQSSLAEFMYSLGKPFGRVQLGAFMRDLFQREQAHPEDDLVGSPSIMSRIDFLDEGTGLHSALMEMEPTAVAEGKALGQGEVRVSMPERAKGEFVHDPLAEGILYDDLGEGFEEEPTRAEPEPMGSYAGDEEATNIWVEPIAFEEEDEETMAMPRRQLKQELAAQGLLPGAPVLGGDGQPPTINFSPSMEMDVVELEPDPESSPPSRPPPSQPGRPRRSHTARTSRKRGAVVAVAGDLPLKRRTHSLPNLQSLDSDGVHTGMVTGVYNEPTAVTELEPPSPPPPAPELAPAVPLSAAPPPAAAPLLTEVPLSHKVLFALGLSVILLLGGTISALASVFISRNAENRPGAVAELRESPTPQGEEGAALTGTGQAEPTPDQEAKPAKPATRAFEIRVDGPKEAQVKLGSFSPLPAPATYDALETGKVWPLEVSAAGYQTWKGELKVEDSTASPHVVRLLPRVGILKVVTEPPGAQIFIGEDEFDGVTPITIRELSRLERHPITIKLDGYKPLQQEIAWTAQEEDLKTLEMKLEALPKPAVADNKATAKQNPRRDTRRNTRTERPERVAGYGYISVNARPWGSVWIDGRKVRSSTPLYKYKLPAGFHSVKVVFNNLGGRQRQKNIKIVPNQVTKITFSP